MALSLSLAFMLLCFVPTWGDMGSALFGGRVIESSLSQPILGTRLGLRLAGFAAAVVGLHIVLGLIAWLLGHVSSRLWPASNRGLRTWSSFWVLILALWVLLANAALFPASAIGANYYRIAKLGGPVFSVLHVATAVLAGVIAYMLARVAWRWLGGASAMKRGLSLACLSVGVLGWSLMGRIATSSVDTSSTKPNIVVVGVDSLRANYIRRDADAEVTPAIDEFLDDAVLFTDAMTPLARTFPAWVSIVSGRHPHSTGAIINLYPRQSINEGETMPDLLRKAGYRTVYATDEVRFSNLDASYGFDQTITPPMGAADFLIGLIYDFPLSNLIVNTRLGRHLFPFANANRAAALTYDPDSFIARLDRELSFDGPTFFAVHLTLAHWPYTWAGIEPFDQGLDRKSIRDRYDRAIERVDRQFDDLISLLRERGALDNAVVVVLSDHGESLGEPRSIAHGQNEPGPVYGHGTDVFALNQYRVVLGLKATGAASFAVAGARDIDAPASLEDIAPTIADLLRLEPSGAYDGLSLLPTLEQDWTLLPQFRHRVRFVETEYNPPGISIEQLPGVSELEKAARTYYVDPDTDLLSVRPNMLGEVLRGRQYAVYASADILAALPTADQDGHFLVFKHDDAPEVWLNAAPDAVSNLEAFHLWKALEARFETVRTTPIADPDSSLAEEDSDR